MQEVASSILVRSTIYRPPFGGYFFVKDMPNRYTDGSYLSANPSWHAEDAPWKLAHIRRLLARAGVCGFGRVLDAGCGSGDIIKQWAVQQPAVRFTGWEISPQAFLLAQQQVPDRVRFVHAQEPPAGPFDLALAIDVIEHLEQPGVWLEALAARADYLVLHVPLDKSLRSWLNPALLERERQAVGHIQFFTRRSLEQFLRRHRFQVLAQCYTNKYVERPPKLTNLKSRIGMCIRQAAHRLLPRAWAAYLIGGYSVLLVVRQPPQTANQQG